MKGYKSAVINIVETIECDTCGLQAIKGEPEFYEFICVSHSCGYGSIHQDGQQMKIDLCQQCFADMCGDSLRFTESGKGDWDDYFESEKATDDFMIERNNIITQSRAVSGIKKHKSMDDDDLKD